MSERGNDGVPAPRRGLRLRCLRAATLGVMAVASTAGGQGLPPSPLSNSVSRSTSYILTAQMLTSFGGSNVTATGDRLLVSGGAPFVLGASTNSAGTTWLHAGFLQVTDYVRRVIASTPPENGVGIDRDTEVRMSFNVGRLNESTLSTDTIVMRSQTRGAIPAAVTYLEAERAIVVTPTTALLPGERVVVSASGQARDVYSYPIEHFTWQFEAAVDERGGDYADANLPLSSDTHAIALGDVDKDGDLDAVAVNEESFGSLVWFNNGSGEYGSLGVQLLDSGDFAFRAVALADLDGDGWQDVVLAGDQVNGWWQNTGAGAFVKRSDFGFTQRTQSIGVGDLNGDGAMDLVFANGGEIPESNVILLGDGQGDFSLYAHGMPALDSRDLALGDLNGDGLLDLFEVVDALGNRVWLNHRRIGLASTGETLGTQSSRAVALGDLNGDGSLDAFVANHGQGDQIYLNDGNGLFVPTPPPLGSTKSQDVVLGDFNGDRWLDAWVVNENEPAVIYTNTADGTGSMALARELPGAPTARGIAAGDLSGDGYLDAMSANDGLNSVWASLRVAAFMALPPTSMSDSSFVARWAPSSMATNYLVDVSTSPVFQEGHYVASYHNRSVGDAIRLAVNAGIEVGGVYYYRVRGEDATSISLYSNVIEVDYHLYHGVPGWWLRQWYPQTNDLLSVALSDTDQDGESAEREYIAGTDPTDHNSLFEVTRATVRADGAQVIGWPAVSGRVYAVGISTNLVEGFSVTSELGFAQSYTNVPGEPGAFYRLHVEKAP